MIQQFKAMNHTDDNGNPAGGFVQGTGLMIRWQDGPLREQGTDEPAAPNGCFVETVILAAIQRIEYYQASKFACEENEDAIALLYAAVERLQARTARRTAEGVEGTNQGT